MSRINQNIPSLLAQRVLGDQNMGLNKSLQRLSTGLRINRGSDDPAGLIASENLRSEKAAINAAVTNAQRAEQVVNVAEGGLQEVSNLLIELQSLVSSTANEAGVSTEEKEANQLQIDSILQTIDRVANATSFQGTKLLNGNFDYTTSGVDSAEFSDVTINSAKLSDDGTARSVSVSVVDAAETAEAFLNVADAATDPFGFVNSGSGSITLEITGNKGTQQFTFASGTSQLDFEAAINSFSDQTGVTATAGTDSIELNSSEFGADEFVRVKTLNSGTDGNGNNLVAATSGGAEVAEFQDDGLNATVLINGQQATTNGLQAKVSSEGFDVSVSIAQAFNVDSNSGTFDITGGGANFSLAPSVDLAGKVSLGIETVTTGNLGSGSAGYLSALKSGGTANVQNGDLSKAQDVIDSAIKQVSGLRGRLGAFQKNVVGSTISSLGIALENTSAAESQIRDTDFAAETASMTRAQILSQAATQALRLANSQPQQVLGLLG